MAQHVVARCFWSCCLWALCLGLTAAGGASAAEARKSPVNGPQAAAQVARRAEPEVQVGPADHGSFRKLAPGVLVTIDREQKKEELSSQHDIVELLKVDPRVGLAQGIRFAHDIWSLEFSFKPIRFIDVDVPMADGHLEPQTVWYLVYKVKNTGAAPVRFVPRVWLESVDTGRVYHEQILPVANRLIQQREDRRRVLKDSVAMTTEIPPSTEDADRSQWGVFTWNQIDPRTDRFVIYIQGLTNAYRWADEADGARKIVRKTLKMNFWRPGDQFYPHESEIRFGVPQDVDYEWVYR